MSYNCRLRKSIECAFMRCYTPHSFGRVKGLPASDGMKRLRATEGNNYYVLFKRGKIKK